MKNKKPHNTRNPLLDQALMVFRNEMNQKLTKEAKSTHFSLSHFEAINLIAEKEQVSLKELAGLLSITPPSASVLVNALVGKELLKRVESSRDRRIVTITLTPKGHKLLHTLTNRKRSVFNSMISKLNNQDKEELARILIKCIS